MMPNFKALFQSRKALLALSGIIVTIANKYLGSPLSIEEVVSMMSLLGLVIWGIAYEDAALKGNESLTVEEKE